MIASHVKDQVNSIQRTRSLWKPTYTLLIILPLIYALVSINHTKRPTSFDTSNNDLHETSKVDDPSIQHTPTHPSTPQSSYMMTSQMYYNDHNLEIYLNNTRTKVSSSEQHDYPLVDFAVIGTLIFCQ